MPDPEKNLSDEAVWSMQDFTEKLGTMSGTEREEGLWKLLILLQDCTFFTSKGLEFTFGIKGGELFVDRKKKSITRATVMAAFEKCLELDGMVSGPKKLGTFGASYLYPIFARIGLIKTEEPRNSSSIH